MRPRFHDRGRTAEYGGLFHRWCCTDQFANERILAIPRNRISAKRNARCGGSHVRGMGLRSLLRGRSAVHPAGFPSTRQSTPKAEALAPAASWWPVRKEHALHLLQLQFVVFLFGVAELPQKVASRVAAGEADQIAVAMGHE